MRFIRSGAFVGALAMVATVGIVQAEEKPAADAAQKVDFVRDVRPILATRCFSCHGPEAQEGGLRLNQKKAAMTGGDSGKAIVPGKSALSRLIHVVTGENDDGIRMPPETEGSPLTVKQIALLKRWIDEGAVWPDTADETLAGTKHWSFQPIRRPPLPEVKDAAWPRNPIDHFVLAELERRRIAPSPEAEATTLLRRAALDITGLPPSPEEVANVRRDGELTDAYARQVDRLLASSAYGERWGRHWLDLARYADSDGYEKDRVRPFAWRYRNWVIEALNRDLPFDQFTLEQLAGDLLPGATTEQRVATGFHRNTLTNLEGGVDREEDRVKQTVDRTNTTATVWLGLTMECCQCHSHKYDPLSQREYYQFYAFFNSLQEVDIAAPAAGDAKTKAQAVADLAKPRTTHILARGDFLRPGETVLRGTPAALPGLARKSQQPTRLDLARWIVEDRNPLTARVAVNRVWQRYFGRGLVETVHDFGTQGSRPSHPRLLDWLAHWFVHDADWSLKKLHRLIVTSATYRQSSAARADLAETDPYNKLLARQNRLRVEAEIVRDLALAASGLLAPRIGGPSVRPPQPPGIDALGYANSVKWATSTGADRYRRGLYTFFQRTVPYPMFQDFDAPDANLTCTQRERSNTPIGALTMQNDPVFVEAAQAFARRVVREHPCGGKPNCTLAGRIKLAFRITLGRDPASAEERTPLDGLYRAALAAFEKDTQLAAAMAGKLPKPPATTDAELAAWAVLGRTLMNLDEFITRE